MSKPITQEAMQTRQEATAKAVHLLETQIQEVRHELELDVLAEMLGPLQELARKSFEVCCNAMVERLRAKLEESQCAPHAGQTFQPSSNGESDSVADAHSQANQHEGTPIVEGFDIDLPETADSGTSECFTEKDDNTHAPKIDSILPDSLVAALPTEPDDVPTECANDSGSRSASKGHDSLQSQDWYTCPASDPEKPHHSMAEGDVAQIGHSIPHTVGEIVAGSNGDALAAVQEAIEEAALFTGPEWRMFMRSLSSSLQQPKLQEELQAFSGSSPIWGAWCAFVADEGDMKRAAVLRRSRECQRTWPAELRRLRTAEAQELMQRFKGVKCGSEKAQQAMDCSLSLPDVMHEMLAASALHDLITFHAALDFVPLRKLEVAWALRRYPEQVERLQRFKPEFGTVRLLRKRILKCLSEPKRPREASDPDDVTTWSEEKLLTMTQRIAGIIRLQDVIDATQPALWGGDKRQTALHRAFVVAGVCSPETLKRHLEAPTDHELPTSAAQCHLNAALYAMGVDVLTPLLVQALLLEISTYSAKACLVRAGPVRLLVSAPHSIVLAREGSAPQRAREYTGSIARIMADHAHGSSLTWGRDEHYQAEASWALACRRNKDHLPGNESGLFNTSNRDPHRLAPAELEGSEWQRQIRACIHSWEGDPGDESPQSLVHWDVHGCPNPKGSDGGRAHLTIGLGALSQCGDWMPGELEKLGERMKRKVGESIDSYNLLPAAPAVRIVIDSNAASDPPLSGAWAPHMNRKSLTQATMAAGFTHSCHLEMSLALRQYFFKDQIDCQLFTDDLLQAFPSVKGRQSDPGRSLTSGIGVVALPKQDAGFLMAVSTEALQGVWRSSRDSSLIIVRGCEVEVRGPQDVDREMIERKRDGELIFAGIWVLMKSQSTARQMVWRKRTVKGTVDWYWHFKCGVDAL